MAGSRPRTLTAAVSPVLVGTALARAQGRIVPWRAAGALVVALALQVGANLANDFSDGIRGADGPARRGPARLTASGRRPAAEVRRAAAVSFLVAAAAGLALALAVDLRLLFVGGLAIAAAVLYTGGPRPYGYSGWGEPAVLIFFGFVATCGSAYVHLRRVPASAVSASLATGLLACALLVANNVRDAGSDRAAGKRTLAVRMGPAVARGMYGACVVGAFASVVALGIARRGALLALGALPLAAGPLRDMAQPPDPDGLVAVLSKTGRLQMALAILLAAGLVWP